MVVLKQSLTLTQLTFYGVGTMVGAGIYSVISAAAGEAGSYLWLSFVFAGIAAFLTVLSYAELTSMHSKAGAEYQFMKTAFPQWPLLAFITGCLIALNAAATSATVSIAFAGYLNVFFTTPEILTAFALLSLCTAVNVAGIQQSTYVSIGLICIEVAGLLLLIWAGFTMGDVDLSTEKIPSFDQTAGIFAATALTFFIYIGFEDVANLSEEAIEPKKNIPRALLISVLLTSALYVLVAFSTLALISPEELAGSSSPLSEAAERAEAWMGQALAVAALFATASTALISLISISRLLFGMARDGDMPAFLALTHSKRKTPWAAALVLFGIACLLLPLGEIKIIASISSFGVLFVFMAVHIAVITLRHTQSDKERGFFVPVSLGKIPVLPVLGIFITIGLLTQFEGIVYLIGSAAIVISIAIYFISKKFA